jgi:hypothetical protein
VLPTRQEVESQLRALVHCGIGLLDAETFVAEAIAMLPWQAELLSFIPSPAEAQATGFIIREDIRSARADWYAHAKLQRILDARSE